MPRELVMLKSALCDSKCSLLDLGQLLSVKGHLSVSPDEV